MEQKVLTVGAAAALLGKSRKTIYRWAASGRIPAKQVGRSWLIPKADLLLFLSGRRPLWRPDEPRL